ncbi:MAG: Stp1/IreP family PP2C-type Ser/Thr phosphatase [Ktedonobacteraceae bacterium]|nr:Stp1/IreP family PP2C-type Ser/Thr phosphatase [Ktedonobacteraceae bacterium]
MSRQLRLEVAQLTDVGRKRPHNEDNMAYVIPKDPQILSKKGALFIVADGMGGHAAGEVASEIAVDTVSNTYYQDESDDIAGSLVRAIKRANMLIHQRAAENMLRSGMGTTCVTAILCGDMACIANVGDSRAYLVRHGQSKQISQDHSWVEEQVRAGLLTRDQARSHAQRNVITRSLGTQADVEVDIFTERLEDGDTLILCSDGLSGPVSDEELRAIADQYVPQESVYRLIERANENGGPDNITAIVVRVLETGTESPIIHLPMSVDSQEATEEVTTVFGRVPSAPLSLPSRLDEGRTRSGSLTGNVTGVLRQQPFLPSGSVETGSEVPIAAGQPAFPPTNGFVASQAPIQAATTRRRGGRRRFPLLLLVVVLLFVVVVGSGGFLAWQRFFPPLDVEGTLNQARSHIDLAKSQLSTNPAGSLNDLAVAQGSLRKLQVASLSADQSNRYRLLQNDFTQAVKAAITSYNQQGKIAVLPCSPAAIPAVVNNGSTNTQAGTLATIVGDKNNTLTYTLADDQHLYQLDDQHSLIAPSWNPGDSNVQVIAGTGQDLLVLTSQGAKYTLHVLTLKDGKLSDQQAFGLDAFTQDGQIPSLMTTWERNVYVVFQSANIASILKLTLTDHKLAKAGGTNPREISVTTPLVSVAAFQNDRLFLLQEGGNVQSLTLTDQAASNVVVQQPIATPLAVNAEEYQARMDVPKPAGQTSAQAQTQTSLVVSPSTSDSPALFLLSSLVDKTPHLFIVDGLSHRVLDLKIAQSAVANGTPAAVTPTATAAGGNGNAGGGTGGGVVSGSPVTLELDRQYASSKLLAHVKGATFDPRNPTLYLTAVADQNAVGLISLDVGQKNACTAPQAQ